MTLPVVLLALGIAVLLAIGVGYQLTDWRNRP